MSTQIIFRLIKEYKFLYLGIFVVSVCVAVLEALNVATVVPLLNSLLEMESAGSSSNVVLKTLSKILAYVPVDDKVVAACILMLFFVVAKGILGVFNEFLMGYAGGKILYDTRKKMVNKYADMSYASILDSKQGESLYYAITSPFKLSDIFRKLPLAFAESLKMLAIFIFIFSLSPRITLIVLALGVVFGLIIGMLSRNVSANIGQAKAKTYAKLASVFTELITGIKQIRVYNAKGWWMDHIEEANKGYTKVHIKDVTLLSMPKNFIEMFGMLAIFGAILVIQVTNPGTLVNILPLIGMFGLALLKLLPSASQLSRTRLEIASNLAEAKILNQILSKPYDGPQFGQKHFTHLETDITFDNVQFAHRNRGLLLKEANVVFQKNKVTAIVGDSGSGKTTTLNLLLGLFSPTSGDIRVNGNRLQDYSLSSWLSMIGFVSQDSFVFHSSIKDNITLGHEEFSQADVEEAAKLAQAHDFILEMPDGYDSVVGEKGMKLSGGQQQRIAIARAILRKPDILFFDEATSSLDNKSEKLVQKAIQTISKNHTVIIIAHRLSTITQSDKIVFLKNGQFVEQGTHNELLAKKGHYYQLSQASVS